MVLWGMVNNKGSYFKKLLPYVQQGGIADAIQVDETIHGQNNLPSKQMEPAKSVNSPVRNMVTAVWTNLWLGWLVVALILFIRKITVYQDFVKYIQAGCVEVADIDLLERFGKLVERKRINTTVELYTNNLIFEKLDFSLSANLYASGPLIPNS